MNGVATTTTHPIISTANQTVLLPTLICEGGMKLNTKASKAPQNPSPAMIHIPTSPRSQRNTTRSGSSVG